MYIFVAFFKALFEMLAHLIFNYSSLSVIPACMHIDSTDPLSGTFGSAFISA